MSHLYSQVCEEAYISKVVTEEVSHKFVFSSFQAHPLTSILNKTDNESLVTYYVKLYFKSCHHIVFSEECHVHLEGVLHD